MITGIHVNPVRRLGIGFKPYAYPIEIIAFQQW